MYVVGVGVRVVKRETVTSHRTRQLHITGEHAQPSPISATLEGQGEGPILRFYKLDAKFTQFCEGRGNTLQYGNNVDFNQFCLNDNVRNVDDV